SQITVLARKPGISGSGSRLKRDGLLAQWKGLDKSKVPEHDTINENVPKSPKVTYLAVAMERYFLDNDGFDMFFEIKNKLLHKRGRGWNASTGKNYVIGAHKFIWSPWPYFKTMFESEFVESHAEYLPADGQFMYLRMLDVRVTTLFEDDTNKDGKASWEGLYIAADRYRIDDLRKLALVTFKRISTLPRRSTFSYLRVAQGVVIMYITRELYVDISKKNVRNAHKGHPEFLELLGELYDAYRDLR
ncbi:hypothetical protein CPC16_004765, partial [Podila verticillata]